MNFFQSNRTFVFTPKGTLLVPLSCPTANKQRPWSHEAIDGKHIHKNYNTLENESTYIYL